jgi:hypothetical protein
MVRTKWPQTSAAYDMPVRQGKVPEWWEELLDEIATLNSEHSISKLIEDCARAECVTPAAQALMTIRRLGR